MENQLYIAILIIASISLVSSLECYTCANQMDNKDKCIKTTMQCEENMDACQSYIRWGIPPYWDSHGDRIYHISKGCDRRVECERKKREEMSFCKRDWYNDWACYECCSDDLCNYYVTMGVSAVQSSVLSTLAVTVTAIMVWLRR